MDKSINNLFNVTIFRHKSLSRSKISLSPLHLGYSFSSPSTASSTPWMTIVALYIINTRVTRYNFHPLNSKGRIHGKQNERGLFREG